MSDLRTHPCPTCEGQIPNNETPGAYSGALSRKDNKTEICSACGTREALADFQQVIEQLSPETIQWCESEALGQVLVTWGGDNHQLSYAEVIERLESYDRGDSVDDEEIVVWDAFEDNSAGWLAEHIESVYNSYIACAKFAIKNK